MSRYKITCKECRATREVGIIKGLVNDVIDWLDNNPDPQVVKIISGRKRLDNNFGWECICGNNDLLTQQEIDTIKNKSAPEPKEIAQIIKDLKPAKSRFEMVVV